MPTITPEQIIGKNSPPTLRGRMEMIAAIKDYAAQLVSEATAWRPMDTAPTDGVEFIGMIQNGAVFKAKYIHGEDGPPRLAYLTYKLREPKTYQIIEMPEMGGGYHLRGEFIEIEEDEEKTVDALILRHSEEIEELRYTFWENGLTHNFVGWRPL